MPKYYQNKMRNEKKCKQTLSTFVLFLADVSIYGTFHCSARCCACNCDMQRSLFKSDLFPTRTIGINDSFELEFFTRKICSLKKTGKIRKIYNYKNNKNEIFETFKN